MLDSPEPSLLAYTKYGCRWRLRPKFTPQALLDTSAWAFIRGIPAYAISMKNLCTGPYGLFYIVLYMCLYSKTCLKRQLKKKGKIVKDWLSLNAGQKYCRMLQREHTAILSTFIKLPFVIKTFVLSIFEWPLKTGFTVFRYDWYSKTDSWISVRGKWWHAKRSSPSHYRGYQRRPR